MDFKIKLVKRLNTRGCCFICLKECYLENGEISKTISIRSLFCHLHISSSSKGVSTKNAEEVEVNLCNSCKVINTRFSVLSEQLLKTQLEMDYLLAQINHRMSAKKEVVQNYSKKMTSDKDALAQLAFVDNLRKELNKKSLQMKFPQPCLNLTKISIPPRKQVQIVKTEPEIEYSLPPTSPPSPPTWEEEESLEEHVEKLPDKLSSESKLITENIKRAKLYFENLATKVFYCIKCNKQYRNRFSVVSHYKNIHCKNRYKCELCNKYAFPHLCQLRIHRLTCESTLKKRLTKEIDYLTYKFVCKLCKKRYPSRKQLSKHVRDVHENAGKFCCDLCPKKFNQSANLMLHKDSVHLKKKTFCRKCGKMYSSRPTCILHEKTCMMEGVKVKSELM